MNNGTLPGKKEIEAKKGEELSKRTWENIKTYLHNHNRVKVKNVSRLVKK